MGKVDLNTIVLISANVEWRAICQIFPKVKMQSSPMGDWFDTTVGEDEGQPGRPVIFFHGGWGKIAAAASTQYVIDRWAPQLLVNLGTCGGFEGEIGRGTILLVDRTVVYDIVEQMGDYDEHIAHYTTEIDLSWLKDDRKTLDNDRPIRRSLLVSGDRDLMVEDIPELKRRYGAVAGDWESGAIAFVAARNQTRLLILRGVTDLVGSQGGEAYGDIQFFVRATADVMKYLVGSLPGWLNRA